MPIIQNKQTTLTMHLFGSQMVTPQPGTGLYTFYE